MTLGELTRPDFPILTRQIHGHPLVYLDSAASSQKPRQVLEAMQRYYEHSHANVHRSIHTLGEEATELYEAARDAARGFIGDSCAICTASADVLAELLMGRSSAEARTVDSADLLAVLQADIRPTRMRCVTLPLSVLALALNGGATS